MRVCRGIRKRDVGIGFIVRQKKNRFARTLYTYTVSDRWMTDFFFFFVLVADVGNKRLVACGGATVATPFARADTLRDVLRSL